MCVKASPSATRCGNGNVSFFVTWIKEDEEIFYKKEEDYSKNTIKIIYWWDQ